MGCASLPSEFLAFDVSACSEGQLGHFCGHGYQVSKVFPFKLRINRGWPSIRAAASNRADYRSFPGVRIALLLPPSCASPSCSARSTNSEERQNAQDRSFTIATVPTFSEDCYLRATSPPRELGDVGGRRILLSLTGISVTIPVEVIPKKRFLGIPSYYFAVHC